MLLERASALATAISTYQDLKSAADQTEQFVTRARQLGNAAEQINVLRKTLNALTDADVPVNFEPTDGLGFAGKAKLLRETINANPGTLNDPPFDLKYEFTDRINAIAGEGKRTAIAAWKDYIEKRSAFGSDDVLQTLGQIAQFKSSVSEISQIRDEAREIKKELPSEPSSAISKLDELIAKHTAAWRKLGAADIPTSVVSFIRAASVGQASLSDFTPELQSWLNDRNLINAFSVKLR